MARTVIAVIVSYVLMFVLVFIAFTCLYLVLGADGAFKPGRGSLGDVLPPGARARFVTSG